MKTEKIASEIFKQNNMSFETATRAGGWTNAVWINGDMVLRLSFNKHSNRIKREVELSKFLPDLVGYPKNISTGVKEGYEWSLSRRINGKNLNDVWPNLTWTERTSVVQQVWGIMQAIHTVDIKAVKNLSNIQPWYSSFNSKQLLDHMNKYVNNGIFTKDESNAISRMLIEFWDKKSSALPVLNHGDITMENLLWNNGGIVSLIDFEHSVIAPEQLDLNSFINLVFFFHEENIFTFANKDDGLEKYKESIINILATTLKNPGCTELLLGYTILYQLRFLDFWIENPKGNLEQFKSYKNLISLTEISDSYLAPIINLKHQT